MAENGTAEKKRRSALNELEALTAKLELLKDSNAKMIRVLQRICAYTGNNKVLTDEGIAHYVPIKDGGKFR